MVNHMRASTASGGTPRPSAYRPPRLYCARARGPARRRGGTTRPRNCNTWGKGDRRGEPSRGSRRSRTSRPGERPAENQPVGRRRSGSWTVRRRPKSRTCAARTVTSSRSWPRRSLRIAYSKKTAGLRLGGRYVRLTAAHTLDAQARDLVEFPMSAVSMCQVDRLTAPSRSHARPPLRHRSCSDERRAVPPGPFREPAAVLVEQCVGQHEELAHDDDHRDLARLSLRDELTVLRAQVRVVTGCRQCRHVKKPTRPARTRGPGCNPRRTAGRCPATRRTPRSAAASCCRGAVRPYAVVRRTRRRAGAVRVAAAPVGCARPRGVACACWTSETKQPPFPPSVSPARAGMVGDRFSSSTSCSGWLHETAPARPDPSLSCLFLKVATHPSWSRHRPLVSPRRESPRPNK